MKTVKLILASLILLAAWPMVFVQAGSMHTTINNQGLTEGGGSIDFYLRLSDRPTSGNSVTISWSTNNQCHISNEGRGFVQSVQLVTTSDRAFFSARAVDDDVQEPTHNCRVTYRTISGDPNLHNLRTSQNFIIYDNNDAPATAPGFYTSVLGPSYITEGSNALYSFGISSTTAPRDNLVISASTTDGQCELVSGNQVSNYMERTIPAGVQGTAIFSVRAIDDAEVEGPHSCTVVHSLRTKDLDYSGLTISNTNVPIIDDETPFSSRAIDSEELLQRPEFGKLDSKDANNDGIPDEQQRNLGVFINQVSGRRQAIEATGQGANCNAISTPTVKTEAQLSQQNDLYHFPHGVVSFNVICDTPGATAKINYYLDDLYNTTNIEIQKFSDKTGYQKIEDVKITEFETQNGPVSLISYQITDGGELDEDGKVDGIITDPVGIAISTVEPRPAANTYAFGEQNSDGLRQWLRIVAPVALVATYLICFRVYRKGYLPKRRQMR